MASRPATIPHGNPIPNGWRLVRLGDVTNINGDSWNPTDDPHILYLDLTSVVAPGRLAPPKEILTSEAPSRARRRVRSGDILVSTVRPYLQGFARIRKAQRNLVCSTGFAVLSPQTGVNGSYIYHEVMTSRFLLKLQAAMTGQAYPAVRPDDVAAYRMPLPPLPEQRAIAEVLDSIDEAIEKTEAVVAATEQLRDALLHRLLTRGVPGWHSEWKEVRGLGTIPATWQVVRLGDVLKSTTYGTNVRLGAEGATTVLRMSNLQNGKVDLSEVRRANLSDKELAFLDLAPGDILFNRTNSRDLVGKTAIVHTLPNSTSFASYLVRLRVRENRANPFWLAALLHSQSCQSRIRRLATPGVSQANINPTSLKSLIIPLPLLPEQDTISKMLDSVDKAIEQGRAETEMLQSLKASAADALLTGRVRVNPLLKD